jgi:DNA replication and repair protein RecF
VFLNTLKIEHLRNIAHAELDFTKNINIVFGDNGAGKTTLLEAIYLLGRAKSFRTSNKKSPIEKGQERLNIFAIVNTDNNHPVRLGLTKKGNETKIKLNGQPVKKLSTLANTLPIALVTPQSHRLIEEGPENRRRILNWGVFHVEHTFKTLMGEYSRSLLQRNNALRFDSPDLSVWSKRLAETAQQVSERQYNYFKRWNKELFELCKKIPFLEGLELSLNRGWPADADLKNLLFSRQNSDRERGFTTLGPHRLDLQFRIDGIEAKQLLSRGQQKILIAVILLSQARVLEKVKEQKPIFLLDDLDSELDEISLSKLCELLDEQECQIFITSLNPQKFNMGIWAEKPSMFHVEHGHFL